MPEHELGDATIPGGATVWGEAAGPGLGLGRKEAGTGQRNYSVIKIFNTLFPSLTTRQNKDVLLTYYPRKVYSFIFELSETNIKALLVTIGN